MPLFSDPRKYPSDTRDWQDGIKNEFLAEAYYENFQNRLKELGVAVPTDAKVLEIGSGNSVFLKYLQKQGLNAIGVDANPRGERTEGVVQARIEKLPFPDETFGLVFSHSVFDSGVYHQDQSAMIKEIARVLKPEGIYIDTLNFDFNKNLLFERYFQILLKNGHYDSSFYRKK